MKIDFAWPAQFPQLKALWQASFGDTPDFIDRFFATGYAPSRCRCVTHGKTVVAALYWFDVSLQGQRMAYIYAVATDPDWRNRGLCRLLLEDTHAHLALRGYRGALLMPEAAALRQMYARFGYESCCTYREFACPAGSPVPMRAVDAGEFARLRRTLLPRGGVLQEKENLGYLGTQVHFYAGEDFLAAVQCRSDNVFCPELLGESAAAPGIVAALGATRGSFRTPGEGKEGAMFLPLREDAIRPAYFGFVFD